MHTRRRGTKTEYYYTCDGRGMTDDPSICPINDRYNKDGFIQTYGSAQESTELHVGKCMRGGLRAPERLIYIAKLKTHLTSHSRLSGSDRPRYDLKIMGDTNLLILYVRELARSETTPAMHADVTMSTRHCQPFHAFQPRLILSKWKLAPLVLTPEEAEPLGSQKAILAR